MLIARGGRVAMIVCCAGAIIPMFIAMPTQADEVLEANYDESLVGEYVLPDPLTTADGKPVTDVEVWKSVRQPEILSVFEVQMFGRQPTAPAKTGWSETARDENALGGLAVRREVAIDLVPDPAGPKLHLLVFLPKTATAPVPAFVGLNFGGNHTVHADPAIAVTSAWVRNDPQLGITENRASAAGRGSSASRWQVELIISRGYALATAYYGDIDPDFDDGFANGVHPWFYRPGQTRPAADEWGSISAWAWGLSRALDYLSQDPQIDGQRVAVIGHSRLGKTALWAGATDPRFALVVSNNSGCGGAALSRRNFGETVARINTSFPHWFCGNFHDYNQKEHELPFDQHMLIALMAPRPVYVASAVEDRWADPKGEFLAVLHANPVYRLLGLVGLPASELPLVNEPVMGRLGYHIRSGEHDVTRYDWERYLDFADLHLNAANSDASAVDR